MKIKGLEIEDFVNYKQPSMFIAVGDCDWKCCTEGGYDIEICHNSPLAQSKEYDIDDDILYHTFVNNPITKAIVIGGLEPFTRFDDIYNLIKYFRNNKCDDNFIIYTGYYPPEIKKQLKQLSEFSNIIIKFGRYKQDSNTVFDKELGVVLSSSNRYALNLKDIKFHIDN